jgi:molybdopterin converting factor small subunit
MALVRYWAAAKAAAGVAEEQCSASTLAEALCLVRKRHGEVLGRVLERSSFLVDGDPVGSRDHALVALSADTVLEVLPPFAGG